MAQPMLLAGLQFQIYLQFLISDSPDRAVIYYCDCEGLISHDHDPCEY